MITQAELKELLHYDPGTGVFAWKSRSESHFKSIGDCNVWNARFAGSVAGSDHPNGRRVYREIGIKGVLHKAHRLAWLYTHGEFPQNQMDHIDGDGSNNQIANLRDVTHQENQKNQRIPSNNTSGHIGVFFSKAQGKWKAQIGTASGQRNLGCFAYIEDAISARKTAEVERGYHENHGRS